MQNKNPTKKKEKKMTKKSRRTGKEAPEGQKEIGELIETGFVGGLLEDIILINGHEVRDLVIISHC